MLCIHKYLLSSDFFRFISLIGHFISSHWYILINTVFMGVETYSKGGIDKFRLRIYSNT